MPYMSARRFDADSGGARTCSREQAARMAQYASLRKDDQIVEGVLRYEGGRQRSLEFTQRSMASWINMAAMTAKLGVPALDVFYDDLGVNMSTSGTAASGRRTGRRTGSQILVAGHKLCDIHLHHQS